MSSKNCPVCDEEIIETKTRSIYVTGEEDNKGVSPDDVVFEIESHTSVDICQSCYEKTSYLFEE